MLTTNEYYNTLGRPLSRAASFVRRIFREQCDLEYINRCNQRNNTIIQNIADPTFQNNILLSIHIHLSNIHTEQFIVIL